MQTSPSFPRLPPAFEGELSEAVRRVLTNVASLGSVLPSCKKPHTNLLDIYCRGLSVAQTAKAINHHVQRTLAAELWHYNARVLSGRLPVDVLHAVSALLPMTDRLAVPQVCHHWRDAMLESPSQWASLDYEMTLKLGVTADDERCVHYLPIEYSNLRLVEELLPRSYSLPLTVHVEVQENGTEYGIYELARLLRTQANRLEKLVCKWGGWDRIPMFFERLCELPALIHLEFMTQGWSNYETPTVHLPSLPNLRTLEVCSAFDLPPWGTVTYQRLERLRYRFDTLDDLAAALLACPNLTSINADVGRSALTASLEDVTAGAARLTQVSVEGVSEDNVDNIMAMLYHPQCSHFELTSCYSNRAYPGPYVIFGSILDDAHVKINSSGVSTISGGYTRSASGKVGSVSRGLWSLQRRRSPRHTPPSLIG